MHTLKSLLALGLSLAAATGQSAVYDAPADGDDVIGATSHVVAREQDTISSIARAHNLGYREMRLANPEIDPWLPGEGTRIRLPTQFVLSDAPREGLVINLAEMRLYYFPSDDSPYAGKVVTYPLGIGRQGWDTPLGRTRITHTKTRPTWRPPASIRAEHEENGDPLPRVVEPGPDNPLGKHALYLGFPSYLLHGTNKPAGIGMRVSHGCLRLYPEDISSLYSMIDAGTPVTIVDQPYKAGWHQGRLYLEAHPPDANGEEQVKSYTPLVKTVIRATRDHPDLGIDWERARRLGQDAVGVPAPISGLRTARSD